MKKLLTGFVLITGIGLTTQAQQPAYRHSLRITSDNDAYLWEGNDRYYTNGIFINYSWAGPQNSNIKKVHSLQLGQLMYNPRDYSLHYESSIDRPYAGYLFLGYKQSLFFKKDQVLQLGIIAGTTGKPSLAEGLQRWYHHTVGFDPPEGWKYQVKTEPGINISATYATALFPEKAGHSLFAVKPVVQAIAGNSFTNAQAGMLFQLGFFENNRESVLWKARVNREPATTRRHYECFLYFHPQLTAQLYNTTIQGGLFRREKGTVRDPEKLIYQHTIGLMYAGERIALGMAFIFQSKETTVQQLNQRYGTIQVEYRFH